MRSVGKTKGNENRRVKAITLVAMMVSMTMLSLIPAASASQITQYAVQRDPHYVDTGDLDCDGDNDIVASSSMGFYLTSMFNDGSGGFPDRQDIFHRRWGGRLPTAKHIPDCKQPTNPDR